MLLKSCPKCTDGDLAFDKDAYGWYLQCVQCAHLIDLETTKVATNSGDLRGEAAECAA
jgi:hypothetical protein